MPCSLLVKPLQHAWLLSLSVPGHAQVAAHFSHASLFCKWKLTEKVLLLLLQFVNTGIKRNGRVIYLLDLEQINRDDKPVRKAKKKGVASLPFLGKHGNAN